MLCAEISESRIATKARPVGERSRFRMASVATHGDDQAQEVEADGRCRRVQPNSVGRLDVHAGVAAGDASQRANTSSTMKPKDSVAMPR